MSDLPWTSALLFLLSGVVCFCILYLVFDAWHHREPKRRRIGKFDARVGRDCYRDIPGVHR